ncbi:Calcium-binding protein E63-1 like protein [Argiope bruennichi]|uniref:Calcium-binding protein E63-1 like protein n=1 Tax=Argiope bruennichi TaxID=94029 RepID=A0A8T0EGS9_ARGBR|nr:Calcium-binding protein E63-1 like protein [Argiope bruennichi]
MLMLPSGDKGTSRPTLTSSQIRELKAAFSMLDKNKDGRVNETEIKCMLEKLGIVLTDTMVGKLIDQASKREFVRMLL